MLPAPVTPVGETDAVVRFFDQRAAAYDREYDDESPGGYALRIRRRKVMDLFDGDGGKVLDVGCGPGMMASEVLRRDCEFWGVDPSENMIDICRSRFGTVKRAHFVIADALNLGLPDASFDLVMCMGVMDALQDRQLAVREMIRVLKPGGTLIITFTSQSSPYAVWKRNIFYPLVSVWHRLLAKIQGKPGPVLQLGGKTRSHYSERSAGELIESEGPAIVASERFYYNPFLSPIDEIFPRLTLRGVRAIEEGKWDAPAWIAVGFILKARKPGAPG
ncbi:MAG: class I SAM-dependent methyltransferase [Terriglobia bacterium]